MRAQLVRLRASFSQAVHDNFQVVLFILGALKRCSNLCKPKLAENKLAWSPEQPLPPSKRIGLLCPGRNDFPGIAGSAALRINNHSDIAGWYPKHADLTHPFRGFELKNGQKFMIEGPRSNWTMACDINDGGDVDGMYITGDGAHGFLRCDGKVITIGVSGTRSMKIHGINDRGDMVGWCSTHSGESHGMLISM